MARRRTEKGAAAVEFGLITPILLLIVFAILQYGLYFWAMQGGSDIARDAARRAAVGKPVLCDADSSGNPGFVDVVEDQIADIAGTSHPTVTRVYTPTLPDLTAGVVDINDTVKVTVTFNSIDLHIPLVPHIRDGVVTSTAEARVEYVPDDDLEDC